MFIFIYLFLYIVLVQNQSCFSSLHHDKNRISVDSIFQDTLAHSWCGRTTATPGLHYNRSSMYDDFDLIQAIDKLRYTELHINIWNPLQGNVHSTAIFDAYESDPLEVANQLCAAPTQETSKVDSTAKMRCLILALYTIRWKKVHVISEIAMYYEVLPYEEEIFALLHMYDKFIFNRSSSLIESVIDDTFSATDSTGYIDEKKGMTVCVLGTATAHSILPALMTSNVQRVMVFTTTLDSFIHGLGSNEPYNDAVTNTDEWNYFYASEVANHFEKEIEYVPFTELWTEYLYYQYKDHDDNREEKEEEEFRYRHRCDILQFQPSFTLPLSDEESSKVYLSFASYLSVQSVTDSEYDSNYPTAEVISIWHKDHHDHSSHVLKDLFDWSMRQIWWINAFFHPPFAIGSYHDSTQTMSTILSWIRIGTFFNKSPIKHTRMTKRVVTKESTITVLTTSQRIFVDNLYGLQAQLKAIGYQHVYIAAEWSPLVYSVMLRKAKSLPKVLSGDEEGIVLHIPFSMYDITLYGKYSIIYNSEQVWQEAIFGECGFQRYQSLWKDETILVWTFNNATLDFLKEKGTALVPTMINDLDDTIGVSILDRLSLVSYQYVQRKVVYETMNVSTTSITPYSEIPQELLSLSEFFRNDSNEEVIATWRHTNETIDETIARLQQENYYTLNNHSFALFYGACSETRREKTILLQQWFYEARYRSLVSSRSSSTSSTNNIHFYNLCNTMLLDYARDYYIFRAKVVLNIQSNFMSSLETHRINHLLSMGKVIISDPGDESNDRELREALYEGCVVFVYSLREMYDQMMFYVSNETAVQIQSEKALKCYQERVLSQAREEVESAMLQVIRAVNVWKRLEVGNLTTLTPLYI